MQDFLDAHYLFQRGLYQPCWEDRGPFRVHWHPEIRDADWNHARLRAGASMPTDPEPLLADLRGRFAALGRPLVVTLEDPPSQSTTAPPDPLRLGTMLRQWGWQRRFHHQWLLWRDDAPGAKATTEATEAPETDPETVEQGLPCTVAPVVGRHDLDTFLGIFFAGFGFGGAERAAWERALARSATEHFAGFEIRHCLARVGDQPAGVATLALAPPVHRDRGQEPVQELDQGMAGFYNLAVLPEFRRQGLGGALHRWRLREARAAGIRRGFLQAESPAVVGWNHRQGFTLGPVVVGLAPP